MKKTVLLVEDDDVMRRMYMKVFSFGGFNVVVATNGVEGLEQARETHPDVIILDVMMPKMNGLELLDILKNDKNLKKIPTVMLTNLGMEGEIHDAIAKGAILYLLKNEHEPQKVFEMVKKLIERN